MIPMGSLYFDVYVGVNYVGVSACMCLWLLTQRVGRGEVGILRLWGCCGGLRLVVAGFDVGFMWGLD